MKISTYGFLRTFLLPVISVLQISVANGEVGACSAAPNGLAGWWPMNGDLADVVRGNTGVPAGSSVFAAGEVGQAMVFDGVSNYVRLPATAALNVGAGNGLTIEMWIKPDDVTVEQDLAEWNNGAGFIGAHFSLAIAGLGGGVGSLWCNLVDSGGGDHKLSTDQGLVATNVYQHVALTYDKASGLATIYLNGNLAAQANFGSFTPYTSSDLYLGTRPTGAFAGLRYRGGMDEVSVYGRALSAVEIQAVYNAGSAGKCPPAPPTCVTPPQDLVGWWPLNGDWADVVGENTGVPAGSPAFAAGAVGQAMGFDGVSNYVRLPASSSLNVGAGGGLTIEMWIKPADVSVEQELAEWNNGAGLIGAHFSLAIAALGGGQGSLWCNLVDTGGGDHKLSSAQGLVMTNAYQHVALTYDKASGLATIYLNANPVAQANLGSFTPYTSADLYLGTRPTGEHAGLHYRGGMDEVSVYGRALSAGEIQAIYNAGSAGKCALPANRPPVADASATQTTYISCNGSNSIVKLDGSHSSDPDGDPLNYAWYQQGSAALLAAGVAPSVILPVGEHLIGLVVSDEFASSTNTIMVTVLTSAQAIEHLIAGVVSGAGRPNPLLASLDAAIAAILRGDWTAANNELLAFQFKVSVQVAPVDDALAEEFLQSARQISDALVCAGAKPHPRGRVQSVTRTADGKTQIEFVGSVVSAYFVQASTNLVDWQTIGEAAAQADGRFQFVDSESDGHAARFYRVFAP